MSEEEKRLLEKLLTNEDFEFHEVDESTEEGNQVITAIKDACIGHLGFFLRPKELFRYLVKKGNGELQTEECYFWSRI